MGPCILQQYLTNCNAHFNSVKFPVGAKSADTLPLQGLLENLLKTLLIFFPLIFLQSLHVNKHCLSPPSLGFCELCKNQYFSIWPLLSRPTRTRNQPSKYPLIAHIDCNNFEVGLPCYVSKRFHNGGQTNLAER